MAQGAAAARRLSALASALARDCRDLRARLLAVLADPASRAAALAAELALPAAPDALAERSTSGRPASELRTPERSAPDDLADALAQAVVHASLLARVGPARGDGLLRRVHAALPGLRAELGDPLAALERTLADLDPAGPWADFYAEFLAAYDPTRRDETGSWYTPRPVVQAQVRLVRDALARLGKPRGFADDGVLTLDPACGTGTYAAHILEDAPADAPRLATRLVGHELQPGPAAVAHLRLTEALLAAGATLPPGGARVVCTDTLAAPAGLAAELLVVLGNPPYDRQTRAADDPTARRGGWIRFGDERTPPPLADFLPAGAAAIHAKNLYNDYVYFWRWALHAAFERRPGPGVVCLVTAASYLRGPGFAAMRAHLRAVLDELWILDLGGDSLGARKSANVFPIRSPVCIALGLRRAAPSADPARVWYARLDGDRDAKLRALAELHRLADLEWRPAPAARDAPFVPAAAGDYATWPALTDLCPWQHSGAQWKRTWPIADAPDTLVARWRALLAAPDRRAAFRPTRDRDLDRPAPPLRGPPQPPLAALPADAPAPPVVRYAWRSLDRRWCLADARLGDFLRPTLWRVHGPAQRYFTTLLGEPLARGPALFACADVPDLHHFSGRGGADVIPLWRDPAATRPNLVDGLLAALAPDLGPLAPLDLFAYLYGILAHPAYADALADELAAPGPRVPISRDPALFAEVAALGRELLRCHTFGERLRDAGPDRPAPAARDMSTGTCPEDPLTEASALPPAPSPGDSAMSPGTCPEDPLAAAGRPAPAPVSSAMSPGTCPEHQPHDAPAGRARCVVPVDPAPRRCRFDPATLRLHVGAGVFAPVAADVWRYEVSGLRVLPSWLGHRLQRPRGRASSPLDELRPPWTAATTAELLAVVWVLERSLELHRRQAERFARVLAGPCFPADALPRPRPDERAPPRPSRA